MHTYSIDRDLRRKVTIIIFALSMIISLILNGLCSNLTDIIPVFEETSPLKNVVELIQWFEIDPNVLGIPFWYVVMNYVYNNWIWKWRLFLKWHKIPNLNGKWQGSLTSSYNEQTIRMTMDIEQNWNKISFKSVFPDTKSESYSNVAAIYVDANSGVEICFGFKNESHDVKTDLQSYEGYNVLRLKAGDQIWARYFNNRPNSNKEFKGGNKGSFELQRVSKKIEKTEK